MQDSNIIASGREVYLHFELQHYFQNSLRDKAIRLLRHPVETFFGEKELLRILDGINFEIRKGDRVGIIGVNGTGKTTLCRCLVGMYRPSKGKIIVNGTVRGIFDTSTGIMPELTGRENAYLLARLFYPHLKDLRPIVEEALEFSELGHFADIQFKQYSKGMQSRLALSIISSVPADLLILDEVFDGADVFFQTKIAARMKKLIENSGAVIFVSHSADQVRDLCNRVILLEKGKIQFDGPVHEGLTIYLNSR